QRAVLAVEATGHRVDDVPGARALRHGDTDLEGLPEVAQVGRADQLVDIGVEHLPGAGVDRTLLQLPVDRGQLVGAQLAVQGDGGLHVVVLDVDGQQAEGGQVAGVQRHEDGRDVEDVHQPAQQERAGAPEGGEREV